MGGEGLQVVAGQGGSLEYYGAEDPRWAQPRLLVLDESFPGGKVTPLNSASEFRERMRPPTLDEVRRQYPLGAFQRLLRGRDEAGTSAYWVVSALFRRPDGLDVKAKEPLHELPPALRLTAEEMETLGPWLGLGLDADKKTTVVKARDNLFDHDPADGTDAIFATRFNWNDEGSVGEFLQALVNLQLTRLGALQNSRNLPTDINEERLVQLIAIVEKQCHQLNPDTWDKVKEHAFIAILGIPTTLFIAGTFHGAATVFKAGASLGTGAFGGGISALLSPATWTYEFAKRVAAHLGPKLTPRVAQIGKAIAGGSAGLGAASRVLGPLGAVSLGDLVGGLGVNAYMHASGAADDPDYALLDFAYDVLLDDAIGMVPNFLFGNLARASLGGFTLFSKRFEDDLYTWGINFRVEKLVGASREFGDSMIATLQQLTLESRDSQNQIDVRVFRSKVKALYQTQQDDINNAYNLLVLTGHRVSVSEARHIKLLIAQDGTLRNFEALKAFLREHVELSLPLKQAELKRALKAITLPQQVGSYELLPQATQELIDEVERLASLKLALSGGGIVDQPEAPVVLPKQTGLVAPKKSSAPRAQATRHNPGIRLVGGVQKTTVTLVASDPVDDQAPAGQKYRNKRQPRSHRTANPAHLAPAMARPASAPALLLVH